MFRDRLFSFQDCPPEINLTEFEEAIMERDQMIMKFMEEVENLKKTIVTKDERILDLAQKNTKISGKLTILFERLKTLSLMFANSRGEIAMLKEEFNRKIIEFKAFFKAKEQALRKQNAFRKTLIQKLHEVKTKRRTIKSETHEGSVPYLNILAQSVQSLNKKIDSISNNFQKEAKTTKNVLINFPQNSISWTLLADKRSSKHVLFSSEDQDNSHSNLGPVEDKTPSNGTFNLKNLSSYRSVNASNLSSRIDPENLKSIREKYCGFGEKFKSLIANMQLKGRVVSEYDGQKGHILNCLERIERKLGINAKIKEESCKMLHHLSYKSF